MLAVTLASVLVAGCHPPAGAGAEAGTPARSGDARAAEPAVAPKSPEAVAAEVAALKERGPVYTPFDRPPRILWDPTTDSLLAATLLPVLERHGLPANTRSLYWILVGADGQVHDVVLQTGMAGSDDFHRAGAEAAAGFRFTPAVRDGEPVSVWVLREISLTM